MIFSAHTLFGTDLINWLKLLAAIHFRIGWCYIPRALAITFFTLITFPFVIYEKVRFSHQFKQIQIVEPPIFIIGHWRSGTTHLHYIMVHDQQFGYVSLLQAIIPSIFLGSGMIFRKWIKRLMPQKRRMDDVYLDPDLPAEEENALANLSTKSPLHGTAFPHNTDLFLPYLTFEGLPRQVIDKWKRIYLNFLKKVTLQSNGKRLLLKNPCNTSRIKVLLELFPDAKFIHIYRNPFEVFSSTLDMYKKLTPVLPLQNPDADYAEYILYLYEKMYAKYHLEKGQIPEGNIVEVEYQNLIQDPQREVERIYQDLGLTGYATAMKSFDAYIQSQKHYQRKTHRLSEILTQKVASRWRRNLIEWNYLPPAKEKGSGDKNAKSPVQAARSTL